MTNIGSSPNWREWAEIPSNLQDAIQSCDGGQAADPRSTQALVKAVLESVGPLLSQRVEYALERVRYQYLVRRCQEITGLSKIACIHAVAIHCNRSPERIKAIYYGQE